MTIMTDSWPEGVRERSRLLNPVFIFLFVWCGVGLLYALHCSDLLIFSNSVVSRVILEIIVPFTITSLVVMTVTSLISCSLPRTLVAEGITDLDLIDCRAKTLFRVWVVFSCMEIAVSGGLPLLWSLQGSSKTYFDFGIPSIHGFLNSLVQALAIIRIAMFVKTKKLTHLLVPTFVIIWSVIVLTRNMMIVVLLEAVVIWLSFNRLRIANLLKLTAGVALLILAFGVIGDTRNSNLDIRALGQATRNYPEWLPSGGLWVYLYVTTPINNLVNTIGSKVPVNNILFPETTALLFPSVLRVAIYGESAADAFEGNLVSDSFNVSTGYTSPFQDFGHVGMLLYGVGIAVMCTVYWRKKSFKDTLIYSVLAQCSVLSIFFNHFFALPVISQVLWITLVCSPRRIRFPRKRASGPEIHNAEMREE